MQERKHNKLYKEVSRNKDTHYLGKKSQKLLAKIGLIKAASKEVSDKVQTAVEIENKRIAVENAKIEDTNKRRAKQVLAAGVALGGAMMTAQVAHADTTQEPSQSVGENGQLATSKAKLQAFIDQANSFMASATYQNATPADQALYQNALSQAKADLNNSGLDASYYDNSAQAFQRVISQLENPSQLRYSHIAYEEEQPATDSENFVNQQAKGQLQSLVNQANEFLNSSIYQNATSADQSLYQTALEQAKSQLATSDDSQVDYTNALASFQRVINQVTHPSHLVYSHTASEEMPVQASESAQATSESSSTATSEVSSQARVDETATTNQTANVSEIKTDFGHMVMDAMANNKLTSLSQAMTNYISQPQVTNQNIAKNVAQVANLTAQEDEKTGVQDKQSSHEQQKDAAVKSNSQAIKSASVGVAGAVMTAAVGAARMKQNKE